MDVRPATEADLPAIAAVRLAIGEAHDDSGADPAYCRYLIADGRLLVADAGGRILGFAGSIDVGRARLLADLFIGPASQGRGVGKALLDEILAGAAERFTFSSADPAALPIYARAGMLALWPLLYLRGPVGALTAPAEPEASEASGSSWAPVAGLEIHEVAVADASAWEQARTGLDRAAEYRYWGSRTASVTVAAEREGRRRAVGAVRLADGHARIEHLCLDDPADSLAVVAAIAAWVRRAEVVAFVPGNSPLSIAMLRRGFAIEDLDTHMATPGTVLDARLAVVHPGLC